MPDESNGSVTGSDAQTPNANGVADQNQSTGAQGAGGSPADQFPDERYKGIQRQLSGAEARNQQLERELQEARQNTSGDGLAAALLEELRQANPERASEAAREIEIAQLRQREAQRQRQDQEREFQTVIQRANEANMAELRELASDLGVQANDAGIDYGSDNEPIAARIAKVRASTKAIKARNNVQNPVTPAPAEGQQAGNQQRSATDGTAHSTQPGSSPTPSDDTPPTMADYQAAVRAVSASPGNTALREKAAAMRSAVVTEDIEL